MAPLADGSAEPPAEGIHKDTDGPDQASDSCQDLAHLPGHLLALADFGMSASRLGHGPHLLPGSLASPARTLGVPGEGAGEGPTSMPCGLPDRPQSRHADTPVALRLRVRSHDGWGPETRMMCMSFKAHLMAVSPTVPRLDILAHPEGGPEDAQAFIDRSVPGWRLTGETISMLAGRGVEGARYIGTWGPAPSSRATAPGFLPETCVLVARTAIPPSTSWTCGAGSTPSAFARSAMGSAVSSR